MRRPRAAAGTEIRIETFGVRILVRVQPHSLATRVRSRLPAGPRFPKTRRPDVSYRVEVRPAPAWSSIGELFRGGRILVADADPETLLDALESDLERFVAERARRVIFIHAGAVGWQGKANRQAGKVVKSARGNQALGPLGDLGGLAVHLPAVAHGPFGNRER